jgi:hypothetical protein
MKRPVPVIVAQIVVAFLFFRTVSLSLGSNAGADSSRTTSYLLRILSILAAAFLAFAFVALWRRLRDAHFLGACAVFLFVLLSAFSPHSRTLWSAFLRGDSSTHLPAPYLNYSSRGEISAAIGLELCSKVVLLAVAAILIYSKRVQSFFAAPKIGPA